MCLTSAIRLRATKGGTGFPAGINAASTFSRRLIRARGVALGEEFRGKGVRFVHVPVDRPNLIHMVDAFISISHQGVSWARNGYRTTLLSLLAELPQLTSDDSR